MDDSCFENKTFEQESTTIEKKLIKKAENWLREHLANGYDEYGSHMVCTKESYFLVEFIEDFKKAMEE